MKRSFTFVFLPILSIVLFLFIGCSEDTGVTPDPADITAAQAKVDTANGLLEDILFDLVNLEEIEEPDEIDFSDVYALYLEALSLDGNNVGANFGAGILDIIMLTQDAEFQDVFDQWKEFLERGDYFEVEGGPSSLSSTKGPVFRLDEVSLPVNLPFNITRGFCQFSLEDDPTINELQNLLINDVLPRVDYAIGRLDKVTDSDTFTFYVTPEMQGDENEDRIELDLTEIYAMLAGVKSLKALILHFCAYNMNLNAYTYQEMVAALSQGSQFATLHPEGQSRMSTALVSWKGAAQNLRSGINFFENESDPQFDDFIHYDSDPQDSANQSRDLDSLKFYLDKVEKSLNSSETFTFKIGDTQKNINISLSSFYDSPIQDLKALFPPYTVYPDTQDVEWQYFSRDSTIQASVYISTAGYYEWYRSASYQFGNQTSYYEDIDFYVSEFESAWSELRDQLSDRDYAYLRISYYGSLSPGNHLIIGNLYYSYYIPVRFRYIPKIIWEADTFDEWILPDPTVGGLFPDITTDAIFKGIFEIDGDDWEKIQTWRLW
ncbi:MAG: hypothetical protein GY861_04035 [bacterium]|nr:hypothetical protein [bacterium]